MSKIQQQILDLFVECDDDVRKVVAAVLEIEQENIHLKQPRFKEPILDVLDRIARDTVKKGSEDEN
jgi:hypothetical protein